MSPLAPSDLGSLGVSGKLVSVAGRVVNASPAGIELADAFGVVSVQGALASLGIGDLALVRGRFESGRVVRARLIARKSAPEPRGNGDVGRFLFGGAGRALAARSRALAAIRAYFARERFVEVETPLRVPAPGVDSNVDAMRAEGGWLVTSPELEMKRLLVGGVPRQFQLARVTRRDEAGTWHEPEFTLLEWYRAFAGVLDVLRDTEQVVRSVAESVRGKLELCSADGRVLSLRRPFERISVKDAFKRYAKVRDVADLAASDEARYFRLMVERIEPELARCERPVFLCDYPISQAALARPIATAPKYAERFELYAAGVELCNGYGELTDAAEQRARFEKESARRAAEKRSVYPINERFLSALDEGMPDAGGNALGVDRLLMLALGARSVQEVMAFPAEIA